MLWKNGNLIKREARNSMSLKMAIIAGDYSNGWSDAVIVQQVTKIESIKQLAEDRDYVSGVMSTNLNKCIAEIEANKTVNPRPKDEPCCEKFEEWAIHLEKIASCVCCAYCGTKITDERRKKYVGRGF